MYKYIDTHGIFWTKKENMVQNIKVSSDIVHFGIWLKIRYDFILYDMEFILILFSLQIEERISDKNCTGVSVCARISVRLFNF